MKTKNLTSTERIVQLQRRLTDREEEITSLEQELQELQASKEELQREFETFRETAGKQLEFERRRLAEALETANNASMAAGSIARMTARVSDVLQQLEANLDQENRKERRRVSY